MESIELTQPRIIAIENRGRIYRLTFSPIPKAAWLQYFAGVLSTSEYRDGERVNSFDGSGARRKLVEETLVDAEGYSTDGPLREIEAWQTKLPASHLNTAGMVLCSAAVPEDGSEDALSIGRETVALECVWGANADGAMAKVRGLRHCFRTPNAEHHRRYSRDSSRSVVQGGSRTGRTRWLGAQAALIEIYDELIETVEGYTVNGQTPTSREAIAAAMDCYHKAAAAEELFSSAKLATADEEPK